MQHLKPNEIAALVEEPGKYLAREFSNKIFSILLSPAADRDAEEERKVRLYCGKKKYIYKPLNLNRL